MPPVDNQKLLDRDKNRPIAGAPLRFAEPLQVEISPDKQGTWETIKDGYRLWRLRIVSEKAVSLNLGFSRYVMPSGGRLFIYSPDFSTVLGSFTAVDNEEHGQLWTPLVPGQEVVIEVTLPPEVESLLELELAKVNHAYRQFSAPPEKSGACNVDVVCPEGNGWRDEIRSVGAFTVNGIDTCTGALINNTAQDLTPYFLTADHCGVNSGEAPSVVVYWNFENSTCRTPGSPPSGQPGDGQRNQFNSGAIFRADYGPSDMTLIELDDPIQSAHNVHWAGWDRTDTAQTSAVAIHHPGVEEKRISFENDGTSISSYLGNPGSGTDHIRVEDWDLGTTEPGSSGSPLFNQNQHIVGQLHGGFAACGNNDPDWYGRLFTSWIGGGTDATRLSNWLDPLGTGIVSLDGQDEREDFTLNVTPPTIEVCATANAVYQAAVGSINGFASPVMLNLVDQPPNIIANFSLNPVTPDVPPATSNLTLDANGVVAGSYDFKVVGMTATRTHTSTLTLQVATVAPGQVNLIAPANAATGLGTTPTFEWSPIAASSSYTLEIATDADFSSRVYTANVTGTTHAPTTNLNPNTLYYWRVTAANSCGSGATSAIFSFITAVGPTHICSTPNLAIPDASPAGVSDTLVVPNTGSLSDLNVVIDTNHTYVGDLIYVLEHVDTGVNVTLISRPGGGLCSGDDLDVILDDEATFNIQSDCSSGAQAYTSGESYRPNNPLSGFDGESIGGNWTLTVSDNAGVDFGILNEWCLVVQPNLVISKIGPAKATVGSPIVYTLTVTNMGTTMATNLLITDTVPTGANYVSGGALNGPVVEWTVASLAGGMTTSVQFTVTATTTITNETYRVRADGGINAAGSVAVTTSIPKVYLPLVVKQRDKVFN